MYFRKKSKFEEKAATINPKKAIIEIALKGLAMIFALTGNFHAKSKPRINGIPSNMKTV